MATKQTDPKPALAEILEDIRKQAACYQNPAVTAIKLYAAHFIKYRKLAKACGYEPTESGSIIIEFNDCRLVLGRTPVPATSKEVADYRATMLRPNEDGYIGCSIRSGVAVMLNELPIKTRSNLSSAEVLKVYNYLNLTPGLGMFERSLAQCFMYSSPEQRKPLILGYPQLVHSALK